MIARTNTTRIRREGYCSLDRIMQKEVEKYEDTAQKTAPNMLHLLPAAAK
jgi:hypothetical protein